MTRVPVLTLGLVLASAGVVGVMYLTTRPAPTRPLPAPHHAAMPAERLSHAVSVLAAARAFQFSVTEHDVDVGRDSWLTGKGTFDLGRKRVEEQLWPGEPGNTTSEYLMLAMDYAGRAPVGYARASVDNGLLPPGKSWIRWDTAVVDPLVFGANAGKLAPGDTIDPAVLLAVLRHLALPQLGSSEVVNGVPTSRFEAAFDGTRRPTGPAIGYIDRLDLSRLDVAMVALSVDAQDHIRRVDVTMRRPGNLPTVVTYDLTAIGVPATVYLPKPRYVIDATRVPGLVPKPVKS